MSFTHIIDTDAPFLGMRSSPDPITLTTGILSYAQNVRGGQLTARTRLGSTAIVSSPISGGTFKGIYSGSLNGSNYLFLAERVSGATRIYYLAGSTWTEQTTAGTRFSTDGNVGFAVVRDPGVSGVSNSADVLVCGVTGDDPRVFTAVGASPLSAKHEAQLTPGFVYKTAGPQGWMNNAGYLFNQSSANVGGGDASGTPKAQPTISVVAGDTYEVLYYTQSTFAAGSTSAGLTLGPQVTLFAYQTTAYPTTIWNYVNKLELLINPESATTGSVSTTSAAASVITVTTSAPHGLNTGDYVRITGVTGFTGSIGTFKITKTGASTFTLDGTNTTGSGTGGTWAKLEWVTAFQESDKLSIASTAQQSTSAATVTTLVVDTSIYKDRTGWGGWRITFSGPPSATILAVFPTIATTGALDGRCNFAGSFWSSTSLSEGVAREATQTGSQSLQEFGSSVYGPGFNWTPSTDYLTAWRLSIDGHTTQSGNPDYALFYRSDPYLNDQGETQWGPYYLSGTQGHASLTSSLPYINNAYITVADVDYTREAQEGGSLPIPKGNLFQFVNDRLYVAGTSSPTQLWVSNQLNPFSFRQIPTSDGNGNLDQASATSRTFAGESITALQKIQADILGVDSLLLWTNYALYRLNGGTPEQVVSAARLGDKGTLRPETVTTYDSTVWFLDTEKQARRTNAGLSSEALSRGLVDNLLINGTLTGAFAVAAFGGMRLFFQEEGASDIRVALFWQEVTGEWVLDRYPWALKGAVAHSTSTGRVLYVVTETGLLYQLDTTSTTDAGTAIPVKLSSKEYMTPAESTTSYGQMVVMTDGGINTTFTTERYCPYDGSTTTGTINATTGSIGANPAYRMDLNDINGQPGSPANPSGIFTIYGDMPAGKRIRVLRGNILSRSGGPDVA